jgi:hypothetical protein
MIGLNIEAHETHRGQSATLREEANEAAARVDGSNPKCVCFVINSCLIIGAPNVERQEDTFMQFTGQREIKFDQDETDSLTNWILGLAIGMIVLGTAFAVLDWCDLLPPLPTAAAVAHAA